MPQNKSRRQQVKNLLQDANELKTQLQERLQVITDVLERRKIELDLKHIDTQIDSYQAELKAIATEPESHPTTNTKKATSTTQTSTPINQKRDLNFQEFSKLVEKLLDCPSLSSAPGRANVVSMLPANLKNAINYAALANARQEVSNIVKTCLNFPDGMERLLEIVRFQDDGTIPLANLEQYLKEIGLDSSR
jgi:hypothetical protein